MNARPGFSLLFLLGGALGACGPSQSGEDPARSRTLAMTAVRGALDNGSFEAMMEQTVAAAFSVAKARIEAEGRQLTPEQQRQLEAVLRRVITETYPRSAWEQALVPLYLENLSPKELEEAVAFQRTSLGEKLMAIQAQLVTGGASIGERLMASKQEEFSRRLGEELSKIWNLPRVQ